jgi:biopolymer transport protein ExbD
MHGQGGPNLTPLLDVVLQLLMFFIICTNFKMEEVSTDIKLPAAQSARPIEKSDVDVLFVNLNERGEVLIMGESPMDIETEEGELQIKYWLKREYELARRYSKDDKVEVALIIRASRDVGYGRVYKLMRLCQEQGFKRLYLRALVKSGEQS